ncbi:MAG: alkene reductase, partial [Candidatus Nucleicultricaceae bacterium]
VCDEVGASRTGIRLSPHIRQRGMDCPEIIEATLSLVIRLNKLNPAYIHLVEADWEDAPFLQEQFRRDLRTSFNGTLIAAGGYTLEKATSMIQNKLIDLAAFGRPFIANPDLPLRLEKGWPLASFDPKKLYGGGEAGYTDYPFYNAP